MPSCATQHLQSAHHHGPRRRASVSFMLALLALCSPSTIQPPCAPYIKGHAHLSSRRCMREELDFGDYLNRPSVHMTGFKEIFLLKARRASVEETRSYADELVGCDLELLERREAGRGHSGSAVDARVRGHSPRRPLTSPCPSLSAEQLPPARRPQSSTPPQGRHARDVRGVMPQ